ncbi:MAG: hypothetical protein HUU22_19510 [Phycisphaerae bacterium]|nr:hypothetical protein [Phycisphaerae bacterium]NUQ48208.1 hypothetical protein [Phycisphaerae bacterium]
MSTERSRIQSLQSVYGFLLVLSITCLALAAIGSPSSSAAGIGNAVYAKLQLFGWLLVAFAFALPFCLSTVKPTNMMKAARDLDAARDLAEQQFIDHALMGALFTTFSVAYLALLLSCAGGKMDIILGGFAAVMLAARYPHSAHFDSWCTLCGIPSTRQPTAAAA